MFFDLELRIDDFDEFFDVFVCFIEGFLDEEVECVQNVLLLLLVNQVGDLEVVCEVIYLVCESVWGGGVVLVS